MENPEDMIEPASEPENVRVLVVIRREDLAFLDGYSQSSGLHNRSAALRLILRDWARVTGQVYPTEVKA